MPLSRNMEPLVDLPYFIILMYIIVLILIIGHVIFVSFIFYRTIYLRLHTKEEALKLLDVFGSTQKLFIPEEKLGKALVNEKCKSWGLSGLNLIADKIHCVISVLYSANCWL